MTAKLHELLAVEKTTNAAAEKLFVETSGKFDRPDTYFQGSIKTLQMLTASEANAALEAAAKQEKALATTVPDTLAWMFQSWSKAEDVLFQKNKSNQNAKADIYYQGNILVKDVPVDELLGLESRLEKLRGLIAKAPTLDASVKWVKDATLNPNAWVAESDEVTVKTDKQTTPVVLYPATDKHPAQIEKVSRDVPVGKFIVKKFSGAITAVQKANAMAMIDELISEVKKARVRANSVDACTDKIGDTISNLIMSAFK